MNITAESLGRLRENLEARQLDPDYAPLMALVQEECSHFRSVVRPTGRGQAFCPDCQAEWVTYSFQKLRIQQPPTVYLTRVAYWQAAPEGALWGAVTRAAVFIDNLWVAVCYIYPSNPNPDQEAVDVLNKALGLEMRA